MDALASYGSDDGESNDSPNLLHLNKASYLPQLPRQPPTTMTTSEYGTPPDPVKLTASEKNPLDSKEPEHGSSVKDVDSEDHRNAALDITKVSAKISITPEEMTQVFDITTIQLPADSPKSHKSKSDNHETKSNHSRSCSRSYSRSPSRSRSRSPSHRDSSRSRSSSSDHSHDDESHNNGSHSHSKDLKSEKVKPRPRSYSRSPSSHKHHSSSKDRRPASYRTHDSKRDDRSRSKHSPYSSKKYDKKSSRDDEHRHHHKKKRYYHSSKSYGRRRHRSRSGSRDRHHRSHRRSRSYSKERGRKRSRSRSSSYDRRRSRSRSQDSRKRRSYSRDRTHRGGSSRTRESLRKRAAMVESLVKGNAELIAAQTAKLGDIPTEKPSNLPLNTTATITGQMTPQMAVQQAMAAMNVKAQQLTGIALPKYYNPAAVNPMKYAEQMQKRKLLWQSNKEKHEAPSTNNWEQTTFAQDQDGKMTAKFRKLMGIKQPTNAAEAEVSEQVGNASAAPDPEQLKKQEELFRTLDQQYEVARMSTHTHRGVGLGFGSQAHHMFPK